MRALAARQIELMDRCTPLLGIHAALADIAERADPCIELAPVGTRQQAARPMAAGLERCELPPRRGDAAGPRGVGEGHHAVGVADVERVAQQRHAERLVQSLQKNLADLGYAVAIRIPQPGDAVRADPHGGGALHRAEHGVVEQRPDGPGHGQRLGDQHVAIGQDVDPAGMPKPGRERVHLEPGRRDRRLPFAPTPGRRHLEGGDALRPCRRDRRRSCPRPAGARGPPAAATGP